MFNAYLSLNCKLIKWLFFRLAKGKGKGIIMPLPKPTPPIKKPTPPPVKMPTPMVKTQSPVTIDDDEFALPDEFQCPSDIAIRAASRTIKECKFIVQNQKVVPKC